MPAAARTRPHAHAPRYVVGVISDTHGLLRPEALAALHGVDRIIHAGDIGSPEVLEQLARIAPVTAVRGNNDTGTWAETLPDTAVLRLGRTVLYVVHDLQQLSVDPAAAGCTVVVSGHSHKPAALEREGVLYFNPGSAGPRRFHLPVAVGRLVVEGKAVQGQVSVLQV